MKYFYNIVSLLFLFIFSFLLNLKLASSSFISTKNEICTKSSYSIDYYFSSNISSSCSINDFFNKINNSTNKIDDNILQIILLNESTGSKRHPSNIFLFFSIIKYMMVILIILSVFLIVHFELHFIFLINSNNEEEENENTEIQKNGKLFVNLSKISPFLYYKYLCIKEKEMTNFFKEIELKKYIQPKIVYKIIYLVSILSMLIITSIISMINILKNKKAKKNIYDTTCTIIKFLHEIKYGNRDFSNFIGLEKAIPYFIEIEQKSSELNNSFNQLNQKYNKDTLQQIENWNLLINEIDKKLNDKKSKEYFFENYPSSGYDVSDEKNWKKKLYQAEIIYSYYPMNDENKYLNKIKNNFISKISNVLSNINEFNDKFSTVKNTINNMLNTSSIETYLNLIKKLNTVIYLYLNAVENFYIPNIHSPFVSKNITLLISINYGLTFMICIFYIVSIILIEHKYFREWFFWKKIIMCFLYNTILVSLFLSFIETYTLLNIEEKITTVENIYKGLIYLFNKNNNIKRLKIKGTNLDINNNKNIFNYLNDILESDGKINKILNIGELDINNLNTISKTLKIIYNNNNLNSNVNDDLNIFIENIKKIIDKGLVFNTNFNIIDESGYQGFDSPIIYFSYINIMTKYSTRKSKFGKNFPQFNCNEYWNISKMNFEEFVYKNRSNVIDCDSCINNYTNNSPPLLLNFEEYTIDEILYRYKDLKNFKNDYYYLKYYFNAIEKLRQKEIMEQLKNLYNFNINLGKLQNNIFASLKESLELIQTIVSLYKVIFEEGINKSLNMNFLKSDLYFLLNKINNTYIINMKSIYKNHFIVNVLNIIICSILIIRYCLFSYKILYYDSRIKNEVIDIKIFNKEQYKSFGQKEYKTAHGQKKNSFEEKLNNDIFVAIKNDDKKMDNSQINIDMNGSYTKNIITDNITNNNNLKKNNDFIFNEKENTNISNSPISNRVIRNISKNKIMNLLNK